MDNEAKQTKAEATRAHLLKLALREFRKSGFDETTMRDLAKVAGMSLGAFYYHFKSKDDVVQEYYAGTFNEFQKDVLERFAHEKSFEKRLAATLQIRLATFESHRELLIALSRSAVDPRSPISPFADGTREIRDKTIAIFGELVNSSDLKYHASLKPYLPSLLWMYLMGVMLFWIFDESPKQKRTDDLIKKLTPLLARLVRFSRYPFTGFVMDPVIDVLKSVFKS